MEADSKKTSMNLLVLMYLLLKAEPAYLLTIQQMLLKLLLKDGIFCKTTIVSNTLNFKK